VEEGRIQIPIHERMAQGAVHGIHIHVVAVSHATRLQRAGSSSKIHGNGVLLAGDERPRPADMD